MAKAPFNADKVVEKLYKKVLKKSFTKNLDYKTQKIKSDLRKKILADNNNIKKLEQIIHPLVRREMKVFTKRHNKKRFIFFEIPLLIESKLMKNFRYHFFYKSKKDYKIKKIYI